MTDRAEIERLLNQTGRTLEGLPKSYSIGSIVTTGRSRGVTPYELGETILHQSDVIELLIGALRDALAKVPKWISVEEYLPENEECVFVTVLHDGYFGNPWRTVMTAFHTDGKTIVGESGYNWSEGSVEMEYDEEIDDFIVPEGWWEDVQCGDEFSKVEYKVTHWMPLLELPKGADK